MLVDSTIARRPSQPDMTDIRAIFTSPRQDRHFSIRENSPHSPKFFVNSYVRFRIFAVCILHAPVHRLKQFKNFKIWLGLNFRLWTAKWFLQMILEICQDSPSLGLSLESWLKLAVHLRFSMRKEWLCSVASCMRLFRFYLTIAFGGSPPVAIHHRVTFSGECWFSLCLAYFLASYRRSPTIKLVGFTKLVECTKLKFTSEWPMIPVVISPESGRPFSSVRVECWPSGPVAFRLALLI